VRLITPDDFTFMNGVVEVNTSFARTYAALATASPRSIRGISIDPANPPFNPDSGPPTLAGQPKTAPRFRDRIIGDVRLADTLRVLNRILGRRDSIRADEGTPFTIGHIARFFNRITIHALEHTGITVGDNLRVG